MEEEKKPSQRITKKKDSSGGAVEGNQEDDDLVFPGFRFHPTDQELVGFYLKRKVEKKGFSVDIIREIDIYKHDPWDLPNEARHIVQGSAGDKDCYFFCLRGRKYRNSIRPNRVTGSGFWKATGIDKPIHDGAGEHVGLKKSLVYYRGSGGRGTKTDWMMHEFRLPSTELLVEVHDAEIWTICRIFKRSTTYNRRCQQKQEHGSKRNHHHHQQQQQQQLQYYYDYYRYHHHQQHRYLHSSEAVYAATEHHQPFLLRGFHGSSSSSAEMTKNTASSGFIGVGAPLPPSTSASTLGWSDMTCSQDSGSTWDELGRIMEI